MSRHTSQPAPRERFEGTPSRGWPAYQRIDCPDIVRPPIADVGFVLETRRSVRAISTVGLRQLINWLAYSTRPRFVRDEKGHQRSLRLSPSAGALHCISTILVDWRGSTRLARYDPADHKLELLRAFQRGSLDEFVESCGQIAPAGGSTAIVLIADAKRMQSHYSNPESLIWRDAGVLLQTLSLTAHAYGLATCMLGTTGEEVAYSLSLATADWPAVGVMLVGGYPSE
jgi:SagB-type dehydrogenase family enzyme